MGERWHFYDDKGVQQGWIEESSSGRYEIFNDKYVKVGRLERDLRSGSFDVYYEGVNGRAGYIEARQGRFEYIADWRPSGTIIPRSNGVYDLYRNGSYQGYVAKDVDYAGKIIEGGMNLAASVIGNVLAALLDSAFGQSTPSPRDVEAQRIRAEIEDGTRLMVEGHEVTIYDPSSRMMRVQDWIEANEENALLHDRQDNCWIGFAKGKLAAWAPDFDTAMKQLRNNLKR